MKLRTILALVLAALLLAGCGKNAAPIPVPATEAPTTVPTEPSMDAQTVLDKMLAVAQEAPMTEMTMDMVMDATLDFGAMGMTMKMVMDMHALTMVSQEPQSSYMEMTMNMNILGQATTEQTQSYVLMEDGVMVAYAHVASTDTWTRMEVPGDFAAMNDMNASTEMFKNMTGDTLALDEDTQLLDGREVYVLTCTMQGDKVDIDLSSLEQMMAAAGVEMGTLDLSAMEVPVTMYVDAETFQQRKLEMDMSSLGDMMNDMLGTMVAVSGETDPGEVTVSFATFSVTQSEIGYEPVELPQLPAEAKEKANQPQMTMYPIEEGAIKLNVPCPEGYTYTEGDYYYAGFYNADNTHGIYFSLYTDAEFLEFFGQGDEKGFALDTECETYGMGEDLLGYKTLWGIDKDGVNCYYAWIQIGNCKLVVESYDVFLDSSLEDMLGGLLGYVALATEAL